MVSNAAMLRGYYWVKCESNADWEPAEWDGNRWIWLGDDEAALPAEIGPYIHPPDKPE